MAGAGSQHHPQGGAAPGASAVSPTSAGPGEDSSDSEVEQEGPQKLIRKVSTSGQIRTKVRLGVEGARGEIPGSSVRRRGVRAGPRPGGWTSIRDSCLGFRDVLGVFQNSRLAVREAAWSVGES